MAEFAKRLSKSNAPAEPTELIPAATVLLLRDGADGVEKLMRKNSRIVFRGFWVFPGGRIDPEDGSDQDAIPERARVTAAREAMEETALDVTPYESRFIAPASIAVLQIVDEVDGGLIVVVWKGPELSRNQVLAGAYRDETI